MTADEILVAIKNLTGEERSKVLLGIMEDFNSEMSANADFRHKAIVAMHEYMKEKMASGENVSEFTSIMGK